MIALGMILILSKFIKIRDKLNWKPNYTFNQGLMKTVKWYLKNIDWCEKIQNRSLYQGERLGNLNNY